MWSKRSRQPSGYAGHALEDRTVSDLTSVWKASQLMQLQSSGIYVHHALFLS